MRYGHREYPYAVAFADSLKVDKTFCEWLLSQTKFADHAACARLVDEEMLARRSKGTIFYWNSHFQTRCECFGCRGDLESRETDLLAIFEGHSQFRFAIHVEIKRPGDAFANKDQARAYRVRAKCWSTTGKTPLRVLPHSDAIAVLLFSDAQTSQFSAEIEHFDLALTFEGLKERFPGATP